MSDRWGAAQLLFSLCSICNSLDSFVQSLLLITCDIPHCLPIFGTVNSFKKGGEL